MAKMPNFVKGKKKKGAMPFEDPMMKPTKKKGRAKKKLGPKDKRY